MQPPGHPDYDFNGLYWYRLPLVFTLFAYYVYAAIAPMNASMINGLLVILTINTINMAFQVVRMLWGTVKICRAAGRRNRVALLSKKHVFIIPNFKEPLHVLRNTLQRLAQHSNSSSYTIVLAMEAKEPDYEGKAAELMEEFRLSFGKMIRTAHVLQSYEMPGKASNVNFAVRDVADSLEAEAMLTILDADAEVCERYVAELDAISNMRDIFAAPILFEMNTAATPMLVCVNDYIWGAMAIQNMNPFSSTKIGFPMSAYSLSVSLVKRVGFWDTHPDGEFSWGGSVHLVLCLK